MIDSQKSRTLGAATVLLQGVVTALFPQMSVRFMQKMIGKNFDNAGELEAKPAYRRQIRAIGVGMIAAGGTDLLMQSDTEADEGATGGGSSADDSTAVDGDDE